MMMSTIDPIEHRTVSAVIDLVTFIAKSINVQIVPHHNLAVIHLTYLLEQLFFASCFSALRCPRLIAARVRTMVEN
jgi:hypothetical protein